MSFAILGIGTEVPPTTISQQDAAGIARALCCRTPEQATWLPAMYAQTGVATRHMVFPPEVIRDVVEGTRYSGSVFLPSGAPDDRGPTTAQRMQHYAAGAPPLALAASRRALEEARVPANTISHLVSVSCTGFAAPGVDLALIRGLGLPSTVERCHVGFMGCHGAINGLRVANAFTTAGPSARVLLCAVELCSLHYFYGWSPQHVIANALFADGAAAVVGAPGSAAAPECWTVSATGSCLLPDSADAMTWTIGDHGFEMTLSKRVPALIQEHLRPWLEKWLEVHRLALGDVRSWVIHPGGPRIVEAAAEALGLPAAAVADGLGVFRGHGNMSSPTVLFILQRLRARAAPRPCVALAFGPGLVAEVALLR
jgi:predicted naringenin-chalcone synthase